MSTAPGAPRDAIEAILSDLIPRLSPPPAERDRPEILPGALLWTGLLVCLLIAQIAASVRAQIAQRAGVDLFDVSLTLLLRDLPYLVQRGDPDMIGRRYGPAGTDRRAQ